MNYVVDASVAVKWFVHEELHAEATQWLDHAPRLHAPDWLVLEVAHTALRKWRDGEIEPEQARLMVEALPLLMSRLHRAADFTDRALAIAMAIHHSVYDCLYIACAEISRGVVITADKKLRKAVEGTDFVHLVHLLGTVAP